MPGIYIMAPITLALSTLLWGGMVYLFSGRTKRYLWLLAVGLPLSWVVNLYIKTSVALFVGQAAGIPQGLGPARPAWFTFFLFMLSPILEELIKVTPLLLPWTRRMVKDSTSALATNILFAPVDRCDIKSIPGSNRRMRALDSSRALILIDHCRTGSPTSSVKR